MSNARLHAKPYAIKLANVLTKMVLPIGARVVSRTYTPAAFAITAMRSMLIDPIPLDLFDIIGLRGTTTKILANILGLAITLLLLSLSDARITCMILSFAIDECNNIPTSLFKAIMLAYLGNRAIRSIKDTKDEFKSRKTEKATREQSLADIDIYVKDRIQDELRHEVMMRKLNTLKEAHTDRDVKHKETLAKLDVKHNATLKQMEEERIDRDVKHKETLAKLDIKHKETLAKLDVVVAQNAELLGGSSETLNAFRARIAKEQRQKIINVINNQVVNALDQYDGITMRYDPLAIQKQFDEMDEIA